MTLPFYLLRRFLTIFMKTCLAILLLITLIEFLEQLRRYGDTVGLSAELARLTLLLLPMQLQQVLPIVSLVAALVLFTGLARSSELVVMRASGVSAMRLALVPMISGGIIGLGAIFLLNPLAARTSQMYQDVVAHLTEPQSARLSVSEDGLWLRQVTAEGQAVIHAARARSDGSALYDVAVHEFDPNGHFSRRLLAPLAELKADHWRLPSVRLWRSSPDAQSAPPPEETHDEILLPTALSPDEILKSFAQPQTIPVWEMPAFIDQLESSGFSATRHRQYLAGLLALPLLHMTMVLIGAVATMRHVRAGRTGLIVLGTVLAGFALFFLQSITASFGAAGEIPVWTAALAPSLAAVSLALGLQLHLEDG